MSMGSEFMKYIFVVNPKSGKSEVKEELFESLENYKEKVDYEICNLNSREETINYIKEYFENNKEDTVFCACGGDGTINTVVNGVMGCEKAIVTCYPCGSGNDFVKIYGGKEKFLNLYYLHCDSEKSQVFICCPAVWGGVVKFTKILY